MNTRKSLLALALAVFSTVTVAQTSLFENINPDKDSDYIINQAGLDRYQKAVQRAAAPFSHGAVRTYATSPIHNIIDIMVLVHPTYIQQLSEQIAPLQNGKQVENGAQFMHELVQKQIDRMNFAFETNNVDARVNLAYLHVLDSNLQEASDEGMRKEITLIHRCVHQEWHEWSDCAESTQAEGKKQEFAHARALYKQVGTDITHFVRMGRVGEPFSGLGGFFTGIGIYDDYAFEVAQYAQILETYDWHMEQFWRLYGSTAVHEMGHVVGANHAGEDLSGKGYEPHSCGDEDLGRFGTAMMYFGTHSFYSDPEVFRGGEACGIEGQANNSEIVRINAPLVSSINDKTIVDTFFEFEQSTLTVDSGSGVQTIRLVRTGDLSQPASVALMANDDTAWELRDFNFGWKEVYFEANQTYADIEFTILPREQAHTNSHFDIKMMYSTVGTMSPANAQVNITSTNLPVIGSVTLAQEAYSVNENAGNVTVTINRIDGFDGEAIVSVKTRNQTAISGTDFTSVNTQVVFEDGQESATVQIDIIDNTTYQGNRTFAVDIAPVTNGLGSARTSATITIVDNETRPETGGGTGDVTDGGNDGNSSDSSGGSVSIFGLLGLALLMFRRKRFNA